MSSAEGLSKYREGQIDSTPMAMALAASEQTGWALILYPPLCTLRDWAMEAAWGD